MSDIVKKLHAEMKQTLFPVNADPAESCNTLQLENHGIEDQ